MVMEKRGRRMKQRHSDSDIRDQSVPGVDAAHEFSAAQFRKVPKIEQRKTVRKHIGDAERDHHHQQQIQQREIMRDVTSALVGNTSKEIEGLDEIGSGHLTDPARIRSNRASRAGTFMIRQK
jgi:hypothetical protein